MDPTYPLVPIVNLIGCVLVLVPLAHMLSPSRPWNTGVCMFAIWIFLVGLATGVNTIVFADNVNDSAPVWCDISTHLSICSEVAVPACTLVITRRLCNIIYRQDSIETKARRRFEFLFEIFLCVILPFIMAGLYYIVQGVRYEVIEELGCETSVIPSGATIILIDMWHILLPSISLLFYSPRIVWKLYLHRRETSAFLDTSGFVSRGDFYRLFLLGSFDILLTLPLGIINVVTSLLQHGPVTTPFQFYPGWTYIHSQWGPVFIPKSEWVTFGFWTQFSVHWDEWINPLLALIFFVLFGVTTETRRFYVRMFRRITKSQAGTKDTTSTIVFQSKADASASSALSDFNRSSPIYIQTQNISSSKCDTAIVDLEKLIESTSSV